MFCGESPCACNKATPKPRAPRLPKPSTKTAEEPARTVEVADIPVLMPARRAPLRATRVDAEPEENDEEYRRALTVLCRSGIVCADDIEANSSDLNMEPRAIRALVWRTRREEALYDKQDSLQNR